MNMNNVPSTGRTLNEMTLEDRWILDHLSRTIREVQRGLEQYNPSFALNAIRDFFWSSFCDWYVELIKPRLGNNGERSGEVAAQVLAFCLDQTLRLLHPFVPYITEHLWQILRDYAPARGLGDLAPAEVTEQLIRAPWPAPLPELEDEQIHTDFTLLQDITRAVREIRSQRNIPPKELLSVTVSPADTIKELVSRNAYIIKELGGISELAIKESAKRTPGSAYKLVSECQVFVHNVIDDEEEKKRLKNALSGVEKEIALCEKKLGNENFVNRAPKEVVQKQRDRLEEHKVNRERILMSLKELE
jgi:valyl-tRNA synthetase